MNTFNMLNVDNVNHPHVRIRKKKLRTMYAIIIITNRKTLIISRTMYLCTCSLDISP